MVAPAAASVCAIPTSLSDFALEESVWRPANGRECRLVRLKRIVQGSQVLIGLPDLLPRHRRIWSPALAFPRSDCLTVLDDRFLARFLFVSDAERFRFGEEYCGGGPETQLLQPSAATKHDIRANTRPFSRNNHPDHRREDSDRLFATCGGFAVVAVPTLSPYRLLSPYSAVVTVSAVVRAERMLRMNRRRISGAISASGISACAIVSIT